MKIKTLAALFTTILLWSSAMVVIRFCVTEYDPGSLALLRLLSAAFSIIFFVMGQSSHSKLSRADYIKIFLLGLLSMSIYQSSLAAGEISVSAGIASFVLAQIPVFTALLASIFLKEKIRLFGIVGLGVSVIGVGIISLGEMKRASFDWGILYLMISVLSASMYMVMAKPLLMRINTLQMTAYIIWAGMIGLLPFMPQLYTDIHQASWQATLGGIYLGIFPTTVGYITYNYALKQTSATISSSVLYFVPFFSCLMGWIFLDEIPTWLAFFGGLIAMTGAVLVSFTSTVQRLVARLSSAPSSST